MAISVVLADDHEVVRRGLRLLLEAEFDIAVVGEAADGIEAVRLVRQLSPAVLVLDMQMPRLSGLEVIRRLMGSVGDSLGIVVLSMHGNEGYVLEAIRAGARGYVLKEARAEYLVEAVRAAARGERYLSAPLQEEALEAYVDRERSSSLDAYESLSAREREVLMLAAEGQTCAQIAEVLCISPRTVETHRANMMHKLGLRSQTDLVRLAVQRGIIQLEP